jgi:hypothetical protein
MDTLTTSVLLRCRVTNSKKASVCIVAGTVLKREDNTQSESVGRRSQSTPVSLRNQCVSQSSSVSLRKQKSTVLAVNYRRRKPLFRRFSVVSGMRSLSLYLVVNCCVSS